MMIRPAAHVLFGLLISFGGAAQAGAQSGGGRPLDDVDGRPVTVLHNARIFTADPDRPWAEALAVRGDRILAVGDDASVRSAAGEDARRVDLNGRLVIPGLNDAHVHMGAGPPAEIVDLGAGGPTADPGWDEVLAAVAAAASTAPEGRWLRGTIGPSVVTDPRATRFALDSVTPEHPVMLSGASGHGTLLNTAALTLLDIPLDAPPVPGGWYHRVEGEGTITGMLREGAEILARRRLYTMQGIPANAEA